MRKLVLSALALAFASSAAQAQTLFTYGGKPVSKQEFLRIYEKNNVNKKSDFSEAALKDYLNLYSLFKMKVSEAERLKIDTVPSIAAELDNYRHQLAKNYLADKEVTNRLVDEAYKRMKEEVHVKHILVSCLPSALPKDTAIAYAKIDSIYKAIISGKADFSKMATEFSDDRGTRELGGDIGYMTGLQTVYSFENAVYNTPVGKVSKPFRTQFGYHIVKILDRRPTRGEVEVQHILLATPKSKGELEVDRARIKADSVELLIKQGVPFDTLVHRYSEDKLSIANNGKLPAFGAGRMVPAFENAAFALKNIGDVSAPVKTDYGYHIIKLLKKIPLQSFEEIQPSLKRKIDNDSRSQVAQTEFMNKIKKAHNFKENPDALLGVIEKVKALPDTGAEANILHAAEYKFMTQPLFELDGHKYLQNDFLSYAENLTHGRLNGPKEAVTRDIYKMYVDKVVTDFEEYSLAERNQDFKNLLDEYRDGIMIFELMDRNVWSKATKDSVGLKAFYQSHLNHYQWDPGFTGSVYRFKDEATAKKGVAILKQGKKVEDLNKALNIDQVPDAFSVQKGHFEFDRFKEVAASDIVAGKPSNATKNSDGTYTVVLADKIFNQPSQKTLDEARGYVSAEYQDTLEKDWSAKLRAKYPLKVDEKVFQSMLK